MTPMLISVRIHDATNANGRTVTASVTTPHETHDVVLAAALDALRAALIAYGFSPSHWEDYDWPPSQ